jgi:hypothetical protein
MAVPAFLDRTLDALTRLPVEEGRDWFRRRLEESSITLAATSGVSDHPMHRAGFRLAANLAARLYPTVQLAGPSEICDEAEQLIRAINPDADVDRGDAETPFALSYGLPSRDDTHVGVSASGWRVDLHPDDAGLSPAAGPAALAAATIGTSEVFRQLIRHALPAPKRRPSRAEGFNLIDWGPATYEDLIPTNPVEVGRVHLVGSGAVGQAATLTLGSMPLSGELVPVDHEIVTLPNLQRYVLSTTEDVGRQKTALIADCLRDSGLRVTEVPTRWGIDERSGPGAGTVLVALDTGQGRIEVASCLPQRAYNAFTGPNDLGWSRHEEFGVRPCLACLYWPTAPVPNRHEVIGLALGIHPERALLYLIRPTHPVGQPAIPAATGNFTAPEDERRRWSEQSLLGDLVARSVMSAGDAERWREEPIESLYRDGLCGGGFVPRVPSIEMDREVVVPLAQQAVFAGIMLATQLVVATAPQLRTRQPAAIEYRLDLLAPLPQIVTRPRQRTPACICFDPDFGGRS